MPQITNNPKMREIRMRKKTLQFLLAAVCATIPLPGSVVLANTADIVMEAAGKPMTVKTALNYMKNHLGYSIRYNVKEIDLNKKVTVDFKNTSVASMLEQILQNQNLHWKMTGKTITISKAQQKSTASRIVRGTVIEESSGKPLIGCTVKSLQTGRLAVTDIDGNYSIMAIPGEELEFNYLQYTTERKKVGADGRVNVQMASSTVELSDIVVTGYQRMKKYNMTGSVNVIGNEKIDLRSSNDLLSILEGEVPGLTVYDGEYRIRGGASLKSGNSPLIIVDNFEAEQLPVNMDQIESITVLKDAAATAIWGSRAANGVIVITTKRGKTEAAKVSYSGNVKITAKPNYNALHRASSADIVAYDRDAYRGGFYFPGFFDYNTNGYSLSQEILKDYLVNDPSELTDDKLKEMDTRLNNLALQSNKSQIDDLLLRHALRQNHMVSVSGGSNKINYLVSGSYTGGHSAYQQGDRQKMFEINSRLTVHLLDNLKLRTDVYAAFTRNKNGYSPIASDIYNLYPYQMLKDTKGELVYDYASFNREQALSMIKDYGYANEGKNIIEEVQLADNTTRNTNYKVSMGLDYMLLKGLSLNADYQYEKLLSRTQNISSKDSHNTRHLINSMAVPGNDGKLTYNLPQGNILDHSQYDAESWILKLGTTLNRSFGSNGEHYVNAVAGLEMREHHRLNESYRKLGYNTQTLNWQPIDQVALQNGYLWWNGEQHIYDASFYDSFGDVKNRELSYFLSAIYTYDKRYTGSASLRIDESNLFGASHKFRRNPIYAFGASWNIRNEKFFYFKPITSLLLRTSFGLTGNFDRSGSTTPVMVGYKRYFSTINDNVIRLSTPPNAKLRWERNRSVNVSLDFGFYNRINGTITYYNNYCYDLLGNTLVDPTNGYTSAKINAADMRNHGWELDLSADAISNRNWTWNLRWVFAYNKNKIIKNKITESEAHLDRVTGTTQFVEGYAREALWSYMWAGLDEKGEPQVYNRKGEKTYDIATLDPEDLEYSGTYQPKYNGSMTSSLRFRQLTLNLMFVYNFGHVFRAEYPGLNPYDASPSMTDKVALRWMKPGDEEKTDVACLPSMKDLWANTYYRSHACKYSSNSIRKGNMIRLREILLNYELPNSLLRQTFVKRLSLTLQMNNVWLWTANREGYDPEAIDPLSGRLTLPQPFSFTMGFKLDF